MGQQKSILRRCYYVFLKENSCTVLFPLQGVHIMICFSASSKSVYPICSTQVMFHSSMFYGCICLYCEFCFLLSIIVSRCPTIKRANKFIETLINSPDCFNNQINVGQKCEFKCPPGYKLTQPLIECIRNLTSPSIGKWSQDIDKDLPTCEGNILYLL